jgi:putative SOS response-associated peptidase YedK
MMECMCGRFVLDRKTSDLVALFDVDIAGDDLPGPSWNIAPTQRIPVIIDTIPRADDVFEPVRRLASARWGLVPGFAPDPSGPPLFNARSETVTQKPSFQAAVVSRRAVIPASGYYEWAEVDGAKTPHYISLPGDELLLFAGLYEWWRNAAAPEGSPERWMLSATILTRAAAPALAGIHDRMPVFLDGDFVEEWLDPHTEGDEELIDQVVDGAAEVADRAVYHRVDAAVGSVSNNSEALLAPTE